MESQLRCLAIQQPFAWAICANIKDFENRTWQTKHRGIIVIVASGKTSRIKEYQREAKSLKLSAEHLTVGAAIGVAEIVDIHPLNPSLESNPWAFGPYCWQLANGRFFNEPIPCKGKLNLYTPDDDLAAKIQSQLPTAREVGLGQNENAWVAVMRDTDPAVRLDAHIQNYGALGDWANLLRSTVKGLVQDSDNFDYLAYQAEALDNLDRPAEALTVLDRLIRLEPDNPAIYHLRSMTYGSLGDIAKSERDQAKVLELDPAFYDGGGSEEFEEEQE